MLQVFKRGALCGMKKGHRNVKEKTGWNQIVRSEIWRLEIYNHKVNFELLFNLFYKLFFF